MKRVFMTGTNSGIGKALTKALLKKGAEVYGIGKKEKPDIKDKNFHYMSLDLQATESISLKLLNFLKKVDSIDLAILNAGILGEIKEIQNTSLYEIETVMRINVWANKAILDTFINLQIPIKQIVGISSGAAVNANKGWGSYSLSKSALNILLKLYSRELENTHITALAPGVIETPMVKHIIENVDPVRYPSVQRLKNGSILKPDEAAERLIEAFEEVKKYESGSFLDVRTM